MVLLEDKGKVLLNFNKIVDTVNNLGHLQRTYAEIGHF